MVETKQFYDDLASYYHLIFENWDARMARQGDALHPTLRSLARITVAVPTASQTAPIQECFYPTRYRFLQLRNIGVRYRALLVRISKTHAQSQRLRNSGAA